MRDTNLVNSLREHAEWARTNEWETPITLGDDLAEAADRIEAQAKEIEKLRRRLKAYEDTGLTPEKIDMDHEAAETLRQLCRGYDLGRLVNLAEADKDGRVVVLPAKTVFELTWDAGSDCDLTCPVSVDGEGCCSFCDKGELCIYERKCQQEHIEQIGKTVFLTREEAEKALGAKKDE